MTKLRVRARAVDMLGRQQIAGIPTAIHELFKNAHDAYAERAEVDFFRRNRVLVLRDDGYGMTREDIEKRWLTLGTDSRLNANRDDLPADDRNLWTGPKNLPRRVLMGEKGIGRLAIAVIAPITLVMTRAARPEGLHDLVVALVHWGLFEQPGIDISAIDIPIREFPGGTLPTRDDISTLVDEVRANILALDGELSGTEKEKLLAELALVRNIGPDKLDSTLNNTATEPISLLGTGHGTHFILLPVAPEMDDDIDGGSDTEATTATKLQRSLLGFSNTLSGETPVIRTEFRDHQFENPKQLIGPSEFFDEEDYACADHHFEGSFSTEGQFVGTVTVFGVAHQFICNWPDGRGRPARCGPFKFKYAYIQGLSNETTLAPERWASITKKMDRVGGVYIYRDGIRVLPYGNTDFDFLDIEIRRNKSFKDWFFSYRRGFGYVALTHTANSALSEKAGREGFRENQAYRDLRAILMNFFKQLAIEFFRTSAPQGETFWEKKNDLKKQAELLEKQRRKADGRRSEFEKQLKIFFESWEQGEFESTSYLITSELEEAIRSIEDEQSPGSAALLLKTHETLARTRARALAGRATISLPRGLSLTKKLEKDWGVFQRLAEQFRSEILQPLENDISSLLQRVTNTSIGKAQRREVALQLIEGQRDTLVKELSALRRDAFGANDQANQALKSVMREEFTELRSFVETLVSDFIRQSAESPDELDELRVSAEEKLAELKERESALFASIQRQMSEIAEGLKARETTDDRFAALEKRNQLLEEQLDFYADFAQMGLAVGVLQHEFEGAAHGFRAAMVNLKPWADKNPSLKGVYQQLRLHFDHLDGYLRALDPMGRRLNRPSAPLSGEEILTTIRRVFGESLSENGISLHASEAFREKTVICRSSSIIGAFVNVIDNAIYWLNNRAEGSKVIRLDADENSYLINNNGPGIEERFKDRIFDFGETTKPGGRGMGLAVSREALRRDGFDIDLLQAGRDVLPTFQIMRKNEASDNE